MPTYLDILRERGAASGLTAYVDELKERLVPWIDRGSVERAKRAD